MSDTDEEQNVNDTNNQNNLLWLWIILIVVGLFIFFGFIGFISTRGISSKESPLFINWYTKKASKPSKFNWWDINIPSPIIVD